MKARIVLGLWLALGWGGAASAQLLTMNGSNLSDSKGTAISNATISFAPVTAAGKPVSYRKGTGGGQVMVTPATAAVSSGAFTLTLVDVTMASPVNFCYSVTVTDNTTGRQLLGPGYSCVQPSSTASWCTGGGSTVCNFDAYPPNLAPGILTQTGPTGPQGPPGVTAFTDLSVATTTVSADGTVVVAIGNQHLSGMFWIVWSDSVNRHHQILVEASCNNFDGICGLSIPVNYDYSSNPVLTNVRLVHDAANTNTQLLVTVGNRNAGTGPLVVQWFGNGYDAAPILLPGTSPGTTAITTHGFVCPPVAACAAN